MTDPQPHTPSTERIRQNYVDYQYLRYADNHMAPPGIMQRYAEFDRWLATIETAAEQRGKEQGWDQCRNSIITAGRDHTEYSSNALDPGLTLTEFLDYTEKALANPYRADLLEGDE